MSRPAPLPAEPPTPDAAPVNWPARERIGTGPNGIPTRLCGVDDCPKAHFAIGLCTRHYHAWRQGRINPYTGDVLSYGRWGK